MIAELDHTRERNKAAQTCSNVLTACPIHPHASHVLFVSSGSRQFRFDLTPLATFALSLLSTFAWVLLPAGFVSVSVFLLYDLRKFELLLFLLLFYFLTSAHVAVCRHYPVPFVRTERIAATADTKRLALIAEIACVCVGVRTT